MLGGLDVQPPTQQNRVNVADKVKLFLSKQEHPGVKELLGSRCRNDNQRERVRERRKAVLRVYLRDDLVSAQRINPRLCLSLIKP